MTDNVETRFNWNNTQVNTEIYGLSLPYKPGAVTIHLSHYTQWYFEDFSHDFISERWVEGHHNHAEFRIGEMYEGIFESGLTNLTLSLLLRSLPDDGRRVTDTRPVSYRRCEIL